MWSKFVHLFIGFLLSAIYVTNVVAQTSFSSVSRTSFMQANGIAQVIGGSPPSSPSTDSDVETFNNASFNSVFDDVFASAVVTNGSSGGTDFAHTIAKVNQFSEIQDAGVVACGVSSVFATIESNGPGVPSTIFATGTAENVFSYTFTVNKNTAYNLAASLLSFPNLDVNDAEIIFIGPIVSGKSTPTIFQDSVSGSDQTSISKSGTLTKGKYTIAVESFSNLSGRGGIKPDTAAAEYEMFLTIGNSTLLKSCAPSATAIISAIALLLLGD